MSSETIRRDLTQHLRDEIAATSARHLRHAQLVLSRTEALQMYVEAAVAFAGDAAITCAGAVRPEGAEHVLDATIMLIVRTLQGIDRGAALAVLVEQKANAR